MPVPDPLDREIRRLDSVVTALEHIRRREEQGHGQLDPLDIQIARVRTAIDRLARRIDALARPTTTEDHATARELLRQEHDLHARITRLTLARLDARRLPRPPNSRGAHSHLHACLLLAVDALRCDPTTPARDLHRVRRRLVHLVRHRRARIDTLASRVLDARTAAVDLATALEQAGQRPPDAQSADARPPGAQPPGTRTPAAVSPASSCSLQRTRARSIERLAAIDALDLALLKARHAGQDLLHEWPELAPLLGTLPGSPSLLDDLRLLTADPDVPDSRDAFAPARAAVRHLALALDTTARRAVTLPAPGTSGP
ncbi:MAG: hypothetical protein EA398_11295 [Deltaproteobacteria bacterium]|nr:MAG: hypothetical protein EA398_11295 [Deltaproteobacteria bacterium]